jgi:hypothetical protein
MLQIGFTAAFDQRGHKPDLTLAKRVRRAIVIGG